MIALNVAALILLTQAILPNLLEHNLGTIVNIPASLWDIAGVILAQQNIVPAEGLVDAGETICLPHGLPWELVMNGPARFTASASPFSVRSLTSQLRCTSAKASGAFPLLCAAS